jgi:hypothetical protein
MSPERLPVCLRCGEPMEEGFTCDTAGGQSVWIAGLPGKGLKLKKPIPLLVTTLRCPKCGYLESYAPPA